MTHLSDVLDLLTAAKQDREKPCGSHSNGNGNGHGASSGHHHEQHHHHYHHHYHHHGSKAGSGGGAGGSAAGGIGAHRQATPMLITEGNALSLLNCLTWDTLRYVVDLFSCA